MEESIAKRSRGWVFTLNNYTLDQVDGINGLDCQYMLYGRESGLSGTPHLQGMFYFRLQKTFAATKTWFGIPSVHIERMRDIEASIAYCKKDGDFFERGDCPKSQSVRGALGKEASKLRWSAALSCAKKGHFDLIDPQLQITQCRNLKFLYNRALNQRSMADTTHTMLWLWGPTRTGKSRAARASFPGAYQKGCNKWWDGYTDQGCAMLEDFDKEHKWMCHHLKLWLDRYPFTAEVKGGVRTIRPMIMIITSNYHPSSIWTDPSDLDPVLARVTTLEFTRELAPMLLPYELPVVEEEEEPAPRITESLRDAPGGVAGGDRPLRAPGPVMWEHEDEVEYLDQTDPALWAQADANQSDDGQVWMHDDGCFYNYPPSDSDSEGSQAMEDNGVMRDDGCEAHLFDEEEESDGESL